MAQAGSYRELNAGREEPTAYPLHIAVVNGWGDFSADRMKDLLARLEGLRPFPRVTMIDLLGTFADSEKLHLFLVAFPQVRIFLPVETSEPADVLNLFLRECRGEKVAFLPCDLALADLNPTAMHETLSGGPILAYLPLVKVGEQIQDTGLAWKKAGLSFEISRFTPTHRDLTAGPWHGAALYVRQALLDLGGFHTAFRSLFALHLDLWLRAAEAGLESRFSDGFILSGTPKATPHQSETRREIDLVKCAHFMDLPGEKILRRRWWSALLRGDGRERAIVARVAGERRDRKSMRTFTDGELLERLQGNAGGAARRA